MSRENVELIRSAYETTARGDPYAFVELLAPDAEWHTEAGGPLEATYIGPEGARRWIDEMYQVFDDSRIEPTEFVEVGDFVVVPVHVWARARETAIETDVRIVHVWRIKDGSIVWTRSYPTKETALEAAKLSE